MCFCVWSTIYRDNRTILEDSQHWEEISHQWRISTSVILIWKKRKSARGVIVCVARRFRIISCEFVKDVGGFCIVGRIVKRSMPSFRLCRISTFWHLVPGIGMKEVINVGAEVNVNVRRKGVYICIKSHGNCWPMLSRMSYLLLITLDSGSLKISTTNSKLETLGETW